MFTFVSGEVAVYVLKYVFPVCIKIDLLKVKLNLKSDPQRNLNIHLTYTF